MSFEDFKQRPSVVVAFTGQGKGKTSASLGLLCRSLGRGHRVAFIQFIKHWEVGEHTFLKKIQPLFVRELYVFKGGQGFYKAGELSAPNISPAKHKKAAQNCLAEAERCANSGDFELVVCDELNNAVHDGLLEEADLKRLISQRAPNTSLCLTGRNFPPRLLPLTDIATDMTKLKHHFDDRFIANKGIDY